MVTQHTYNGKNKQKKLATTLPYNTVRTPVDSLNGNETLPTKMCGLFIFLVEQKHTNHMIARIKIT